MLDFESLDGFVISVNYEFECDAILDDILCGDDNEFKKVIKYPLAEKQRYIVDYFTSTYKYVFCRRPNMYFICENKLGVID